MAKTHLTGRRWLALLPLLMVLAGCVRREGRNSDCRWPVEPGAVVLQAGSRDYAGHLRADAELAEELAIEYMDVHYGPRSPEAAGQAKNRCLGVLFGEIGKSHGVTPREVFAFLDRRSLGVDVALNAPFFVAYGLAAWFAAGRLLRRYPARDGWVRAAVMVALCALAAGVLGILLGEQWSILAESLRVGTGHLSNRVERLPWARNQMALLAFCAALFGAVAAVRYRRGEDVR
ncbi:MAG: hypothetical protein JSU00_27345 [Acidobacteria bacterium]|nr:hypothetical protein [Acidobacteriota bacterium]